MLREKENDIYTLICAGREAESGLMEEWRCFDVEVKQLIKGGSFNIGMLMWEIGIMYVMMIRYWPTCMYFQLIYV